MISAIEELIIKTADAGIRLQSPNGAMPVGCNGPHRHKMTAARNTSHWSITFLHAYLIDGNSKYRIAAELSLDLLISDVLRPMGGAFWHRNHKGKNSFNGLIGQSWSLEALLYGWKLLDNDLYRTVGLEVFQQHHFDKQHGLWYQLKLDGSPGAIERTLNQQIWLAAMGLLLAERDYPEIAIMVQEFLSRLPQKLPFRLTNLFPAVVSSNDGLGAKLKHLVIEWIFMDRRLQKEIEVGYHIFTLCGLALLYKPLNRHEFWSSRVFTNRLNQAFTREFISRLSENRYGLPYNVPGFELAYVYSVFKDIIFAKDAREISEAFFLRQLNLHFDRATNLLRLNSEDPQTLAARIYEICRIPASYYSSDLASKLA